MYNSTTIVKKRRRENNKKERKKEKNVGKGLSFGGWGLNKGKVRVVCRAYS